MRIIRILIILIVIGWGWLAITTSAQAQSSSEPINLTISPVTLSLETVPGEAVSTSFKVRNNSAQVETLQLELGSFRADPTGAKPELLDVDPNQEYLTWLKLAEPLITVQPGEWHSVEVTFSPPSSAALPYYYVIYLNRVTDQATLDSGTKIEAAPALLVLTNVNSPQSKREIQLGSFKVNSFIKEFLPLTFSLEIENTANTHVTPLGNIFIDGQGQKDIAVLSLNPGFNSVLPGSKRAFEIVWDDGFPVFDAQKGGLNWDFNALPKIRFGKYTAHVVLVYDNGERDVPIESYLDFWIIPWRLIAVAVAIPVIPALLVYLFMKWRFKKYAQ